jgi:xanthine dehydrogenase YagR molybdenum-binding subunit
MSEQIKSIGQPLNRIEALQKVTGAAKYAADYNFKDTAFGVLVTSTITKGHITDIDSTAAEKLPGVLSVISHLNAPAVPGYEEHSPSPTPIFSSQEFRVFQDDTVYFNMQPVAMVVATSLEQAQYASTLIKITYHKENHETDIHHNTGKAVIPARSSDYSRGDTDAWKKAPFKIEQEYHTPLQVHNTIEPHATTAYWQDDEKLFIYNKTQGVKNTQQQYAKHFGLSPDNVHVHAPYVGGAFGSSSKLWPHEMAAVLGAKKVGRPVKVACTREQVFNMVGYRPYSVQRFCIGAESDATITGIRHEAVGSTSRYEQFTERVVEPTKSLYKCANLSTAYKLVHLDVSTPCPARGPGETSGSFAMECAMDELAYALNADPLTLRVKNFADTDLMNNKPWASNYLRECYTIGAEKFGWSKRNKQPLSMRNDGWLVGMGMSTGIYKAERTAAAASITMKANGTALIRCSVADTGPGSATIMTQIAADALGIPANKVQIEWANSSFPEAPPQYASHTTASTGSAVHDAALALKQKFLNLDSTSPEPDYKDILIKNKLKELEATVESKPGSESSKFSGKSFSVNFVEVNVHPTTGVVKVIRVVTVIDAGRIINHKTARSQVIGSVVWGIGIALMEEGIVDHRYGRYVNKNLADYHLPVNADIPQIDVHFIDKADTVIDPMGAKGLGEIGLIGFTAAIANAVYHATGKRIRKLPITPDKLLVCKVW